MRSPSAPPDHTLDEEALLQRTLAQAEDLVYVDPAAAHRLLIPFRRLVDGLDISSAHLEIGSRQLLGNVANQQLDFVLARRELTAALERATSAGLVVRQVDVIRRPAGRAAQLRFLAGGRRVARAR